MEAVPGYIRVTGRRTRNIFNPASEEPFKLSRSKIELFTECPRCFYLDRRLGVGRPPGFPFTLNSAVDTLLKKEFDIHRTRGSRHPLMEAYEVDAVPFIHEKMNEWRDNFKGVQHYHRPTNLVITGALDDIWINKEGELMVVDYKATSTKNEVTLNARHHEAFKRQLEIYQWLLRQNDFKVSDMGYFVYANGDKDKEAFDGKLEFNVKIIPYKGSDSWVEGKVIEAHKCMMGEIPASSPTCPYCLYREAAGEY
ncbi:MAG: PD-(D/E)XK nuclease family protein [Patescibacteria group bacterium]|nr:PD-(D/E)XK nuclease family protein [Patescibacteria group bacterium]